MDEFENKKWFHCVHVNLKLKEEKDFDVYVDKNGTVQDLLNEAKKEVGESKISCCYKMCGQWFAVIS